MLSVIAILSFPHLVLAVIATYWGTKFAEYGQRGRMGSNIPLVVNRPAFNYRVLPGIVIVFASCTTTLCFAMATAFVEAVD